MGTIISLLFCGDFVPHGRTKFFIEKEEYDKIISEGVKDIIESSNYSVVNLEAPTIKANFRPIEKVGPTLSSVDNVTAAIRYAGFKMTALANNHMNDFGGDGIIRTIEQCKNSQLDVVGAGANRTEASKICYKEIQGKKFAFINCCEHEFSITDPHMPGCNPLDPVILSYSIKEAKRNAEYVVMIIHGGIEHYQLPTPRMQRVYRFFVDEGADVVINHHQHCYSGYEIYNGRPIVYGLGNFCFDWQQRTSKKWQEGYMAKVSFEANKIGLELFPYIQNDLIVGVRLMSVTEKNIFLKDIDRLNSIIADEKLLTIEFEKFLNQTDNEYRAALSIYPGRLLTAICRKGLLPIWKNNYRFRRMLLNITCESHQERLVHYLKSKIKS